MYKKIYFVGIKGVGMATIAVIAKEAGFIVAGSDIDKVFITDKILKESKIDVFIGFKAENVNEFFGTTPPDECLLITTGAHDGFNNVEVESANGIKILSHGEAVGVFMSGSIFGRSDLEGISVAGAHGKTTIGSMVATFLKELNFDPSYTIGVSEINPIGFAGHFGKGKYFVAEADEYVSEANYDKTPKFLYQKPHYLIINNIDFDHPDFYKDLEDVKKAFANLLENLSPNDVLIANGDDASILEIIKTTIEEKQRKGEKVFNVITYGTGNNNEFIIKNFKSKGWESEFEVFRGETQIGKFCLSVPGYHNAKNSLSVLALLTEIGVSVKNIQKVFPLFLGTKRRLEHLGKTDKGIEVFDDYAHHPEEIRKTLEALKSSFPDKKITVVFQAHTFSRTKSLMSQFVSSFVGVNELIIMPTFASMRDKGSEKPEEDRAFIEKIRPLQQNVKLIETSSDVVKYIRQNIKSDSIVITMGAGDVYEVANSLCDHQ